MSDIRRGKAGGNAGGGSARAGESAPRAGGSGSRDGGPPRDQVEGRQPVLEALRGGRRVHRLFVSRGERQGSIREILDLAGERAIPVDEVDPAELERRSRTRNHQGVIALVEPVPDAGPDDLLAVARGRGEDPFLVVAAEVQDPQNLGSLLRSAEAAGVHGVVIPRHRAAGVTPAVVRASAGAAEHIPVVRVTNLTRTLEQLKERGIWVFGADPSGEKVYYEADLRGPLALVVGSEGRGIPRLIKERCDFLVRIPMSGRVGSLNVSVAAGIILFEVARRRRSDTAPTP